MQPEPTKRVEWRDGSPEGPGARICRWSSPLPETGDVSKDSSRSGVLLKDRSGFCVGGGMQEKVWTVGNQ